MTGRSNLGEEEVELGPQREVLEKLGPLADTPRPVCVLSFPTVRRVSEFQERHGRRDSQQVSICFDGMALDSHSTMGDLVTLDVFVKRADREE